MDFTYTALLASIRRRAAQTTATATGTADADLLAYANEELHSSLVPLLIDSAGEHLIPQFDYEVSTVSGTDKYRIPPRALYGRIREAVIEDSTGAVHNLIRTSLDEEEEWSGVTGKPSYFYVRGPYVVLRPVPATAETLRISYYVRPAEVSATTTDFKALTVVSGTALTTASAHGWTTANTIDVMKASSPFEVLSIGITPSAASSSSITLPAAVDGLEVGDYVCLQEKTPIPQIAAELHPILSELVVAALLQAQGFLSEAGAARQSCAEKVAKAVSMLSPRTDGEPEICSPGAFSLLGGYDSGGW